MKTAYIILTILSLFLLSCTADVHDYTPPTKPDGAERVNVQITVNTPSPKLPQALSAYAQLESLINKMQIHVLEDGEYAYSVPGTNIGNGESSVTFSARLYTSAKPVKLLFVANSDDALTDFTNSGIARAIPMFGEYSLDKIEANNPPTNIHTKMLRAVARVDVIKDTGVSQFEMKTIQAFRANDKIQVEPDFISDPQNPSVTSPSIPDNAEMNVNTLPIDVEDDASVSQLYLPEAAAPDENNKVLGSTCVIVGGLFNGQQTYYRADFDSKADGHPFGQVLRNHRYVIVIKRVSAPGWNTPEDAANHISTGIVAEVKSWEENTTEMYFDGSNHFGISSRDIYVRYRTGSENFFEIDTDLSSYTLQWADSQGNLLPESSPGTSVENSMFKAEIIEGGNRIRVQALADNLADEATSNYLVISAGRWKIPVNAIHESHKKYAKTYVNILSTSDIGHLGSNSLTNGLGAASGDGIRGILNANFTPSGTVKIAGFDYTLVAIGDVSGSTVNVSPSRLAGMDVIFLTYASNPSATVAGWIMDWLEASPHRVLIVAADVATTNPRVLAALEGSGTWSFITGDGGNYVLKGQEQDDYFTSTGPFGAVGSDLAFGRYDIYMGRATGYSSDVQPLLVHSVDGSLIMGVNKKQRVVYLGDCNLLQARTGNYINNTTGNVSYDRARLMANLWAWIVEEVVLPGKLV